MLLRQLVPLTFLIRVQAFRDPLRGELPRVQIFMIDEPKWFTWDAQLLSYRFRSIPSVFQDKLVILINNLRGGHCFGSYKTRRNTGGKITTLKLGHPHFDGRIRWCMFSSYFCQNGVNELRFLAMQEKQFLAARDFMFLKSCESLEIFFQPL